MFLCNLLYYHRLGLGRVITVVGDNNTPRVEDKGLAAEQVVAPATAAQAVMG
jgi:hypothetical protein